MILRALDAEPLEPEDMAQNLVLRGVCSPVILDKPQNLRTTLEPDLPAAGRLT